MPDSLKQLLLQLSPDEANIIWDWLCEEDQDMVVYELKEFLEGEVG